MLNWIRSKRIPVLSSIPEEAKTNWGLLLDRVAEKALKSQDPKWELLFVALPMFALRRDLVNPTDCNEHLYRLLTTDCDSLYAVTEFVTIPNENPPTSAERAKALIKAQNFKKARSILTGTATFAKHHVIPRLKKKIRSIDGETVTQVELPEKVNVTPLIRRRDVIRAIRALSNGVAPSTGMLRSEHLKPLTYSTATYPNAWLLLQTIINDIAMGTLKEHLKAVILHDVMCALEKADGGVRPIALCNTLTKIAVRILLQRVPRHIVGKFQYGYGKEHGTVLAAKKIQQYLDNGMTIVKSDVTNGFSSVPRDKIAKMLFDAPATKPLWNFFIQRYLDGPSTYLVNTGENGIEELCTSLGLNQGDTSSLLLFDFYVSDINIPCAVDLIQIHDDVYVVCNAMQAGTALDQLNKYFSHKQLSLNVGKTKILTPTPHLIPRELNHLIITEHVKIGGGYIHPTQAPLPAAVLDSIAKIDYLREIPHHHAYTLLKKSCFKSWEYLVEATSHAVAADLVPRIIAEQKKFVKHILSTVDANTIPWDEEQLFEEPVTGGVGLFNPDFRKFSWSLKQNAKRRKELATSTPIITIGPFHRHLTLDNETFATLLATLLTTWTPRKFWCKIEEKEMIFTMDRVGSEQFIHHAMTCSSCVSGLKTVRHDQMADAFLCAVKANRIAYVHEPKGWPMRTKPSNSGKDGPDGQLKLGEETVWLDFSVAKQAIKPDSHCAMEKRCSDKAREYLPATQKGFTVIPFVVSYFGAVQELASQLLMKMANKYGKKVVREVRNGIGAKLAVAMCYFRNNIELRASLL